MDTEIMDVESTGDHAGGDVPSEPPTPVKRKGGRPKKVKVTEPEPAPVDEVLVADPVGGNTFLSARIGDKVTFWLEEGGSLRPRPAMLEMYSDHSNTWGIIMHSGPANIPYHGIPWSATPKQAHWTLNDQVEPIALRENP